MRHPFWTWTGLLTLGFAGCIHGFDGRKTSTQSVADQNASAPVVVGPFRKSLNQFAPQSGKQAGKQSSQQAATDSKSPNPTTPKREPLPRLEEINKSATKTAANKTPPIRRDSQVTPTQYQQTKPVAQEPVYFPDDEPVQPPVAAPQQPSVAKKAKPSVNSTPSEPAPFAEFDRAIPISTKSNDSKVLPVSGNEPVLAPPTESSAETEPNNPLTDETESNSNDAQAESLPMIIPSQSASKPSAPRELPPQATVLSKEQTSVAETSKSTARPRDVALLVEQVFEDLRQRRLDDARERTEWLKRLVASGAAPAHSSADSVSSADATAATKADTAKPIVSREPKRLDAEEGKALSKDGVSSTKTLEPSAQSDDDVPLSK